MQTHVYYSLSTILNRLSVFYKNLLDPFKFYLHDLRGNEAVFTKMLLKESQFSLN